MKLQIFVVKLEVVKCNRDQFVYKVGGMGTFFMKCCQNCKSDKMAYKCRDRNESFMKFFLQSLRYKPKNSFLVRYNKSHLDTNMMKLSPIIINIT